MSTAGHEPEPIGHPEMVPIPATGRRFTTHLRVRLGDVAPTGRLRLDALARYLQDVSNDDTRDAALANELAWVVRRTAVTVTQFPVFGEELTLTTFCSGIGARWAERRVALTGTAGGIVDAATLWIQLDPATGRPLAIGQDFLALFAEAAGGRKVRPTLIHHDPPQPDASQAAPGGGIVTTAQWPVRYTDLDLIGHMNNANYWAVVEEHLGNRETPQRPLGVPMRASMEFRTPVEAHHHPEVVTRTSNALVELWLVGESTVLASGRLT
jgi:acyl-ACP thioesterase